jgi:hypothetical protein
MVDVCCEGSIETSLVITNNLPVPKTINVFGGSIDMDSVENNVSSFSIANPAFPLPQSGGPYVFDEATGYMYVGGISSLSIVDTLNNNAIVNTITTGVGDSPDNITIVSSLRKVYVTCSGVSTFMNNLIVINADSGDEIARYTVGYTPNQSVYCPTNGYLYIACRFGAQLSIFNTATNSVVGDMSLSAGEPVCLCYDPIHEYIYISNSDPNPGSGIVDVFSILGNVLLTPIPVGDEPVQVIYQNGFVYVATQSDVSVSRINTNTNINSLITGFTGSRYLFYSSVNNRVYVCGLSDAFLGVINPLTGLAETPIDTGGLVANYILYNAINECFYVYTPAEILIFNSNFSELITTLPLPAVSGGTFSANGSLYQSSTTAFNVAVVSITPGVLIEGSGGVTLDQLNSDFTSNPICICKLVISSTDQAAFNVPLSKNETLSTGSILNTKISLLAKYNVDDVQSVVVLNKEDFKTCVIDGDNYLNWQIPANSIITFVLSYCQARREDLIGKELNDKPRARKKRYIHGAFKFAIN